MFAEQLELPYESGRYYEDWYRRLLAELGQVATVVGLKEIAFHCDAQASALAHAMSGREQRQFQARWLGPFLHKAPDLALATVLIEPAGAEALRRAPLSPEEELARLREAIGEVCGPMIQQAINGCATQCLVQLCHAFEGSFRAIDSEEQESMDREALETESRWP